MKVAIVGSRRYENTRKVKDLFYSLREKFGSKLTIVSGGCKVGADKYEKKYALEFELQYEEYPPFHHSYNLHCVLPEQCYGKSFNVKHYFVRNKQIAENSDIVIGFIPSGHVSNGTESTLKYAKKIGKKTLIIS